MNTVGKILVVFVTATSLGFLAFVAALRNGGPDWLGEMRSPELQKEFVFTTEPGEKVTYSVKYRRSDASLGDKTPVMAEVVLRARKRLEEEANKKFQELSPIPQQEQDRLKAMVDLIPIDKAGVETREKNFNARIQQLWDEIQVVGNEFATLTIQSQDVLRVAEERRGEVYRLANQLELLRTDQFAAVVQQRVLQDELVRLEENKRRLDRRQNQLKQQLNDGY
jgi:hypothetical protein